MCVNIIIINTKFIGDFKVNRLLLVIRPVHRLNSSSLKTHLFNLESRFVSLYAMATVFKRDAFY